MKKSLILGIGGVLLITGCCKKLVWEDCGDNCKAPPPKPVKVEKPVIKKMQIGEQVCFIENGYKKSCILKLEARGVGVSPCNGSCSKSQAVAMARRAAMLDAYKALTEKLYGVKINGRDTVKNMVLQNSSIRAYVEGVIRGAKVEEEEYKNGIYNVVLSVVVDPKKWNEYIKTVSTF